MPNPIEAREWLLYPERESALTPSLRLLVTRIHDQFDKGHLDAVDAAVEKLLAGRARLRTKQAIAEATLEAALGCYLLNRYEEAVTLLERAESGFQPQDHFVAVTLWMKGCVSIELTEGQQMAFTAWSECLDVFQRRLGMAIGEDHERWYQHRVETVRAALDTLQAEPSPPPPPGESSEEGNGWAPEFPAQPPPNTEKKPLREPREDPQLQLFRVVEEVPAGGFGPVGFQPFTIGEVNVKEVWIDDVPHRMVNLQGNSNLIFLRSSQYVVARVTGDSMNKPDPRLQREGIDRGDYVLVRLQETAENGDIIAAEIDGVDDRATLKRLRIEDGGRRIILMPNSTNPDHDPYEFDALNEGFRVRGVALVVFKPLR